MNVPNPLAVSANSRGMDALRSGDFASAIEAFTKACAADPVSGPLKRNLATAHRAMGNDQAELDALEGALNIDRRDLLAWLRKAEAHQRRGEKGDALTAWNGTLQLAAPLQPWQPPLKQSLEDGQRFVRSAVADLRTVIDDAIEPLRVDLDALERRRTKAFVETALGERKIYTNECAGLFYPFLPADEFFDSWHFPWFEDFASATGAIQKELLSLLEDPGEHLRPYVRMDRGIGETKWSTLDQTLDWGACFLYEFGVPNTPVLERCPATRQALAAIPQSTIPGQAPNAFFSILKPKTRIPPHTGVSNTRAIVHLPLIVPSDCGFRVGNETREWRVSEPFAFDDTIEHEAWNESTEIRAVLICDVWNPHLTAREQQLISQYYQTLGQAGYMPAV